MRPWIVLCNYYCCSNDLYICVGCVIIKRDSIVYIDVAYAALGYAAAAPLTL